MNQQENTVRARHPWADILIALANGEAIAQKRTCDEDDAFNWKPLSPTDGGEHHLLTGQTGTFEFRIEPRTLMVNGTEIPAPMNAAPQLGQAYWVPAPGRPVLFTEEQWHDSAENRSHLLRGIAHATMRGAQAHAAAWTGQRLEAAE